MVFRLLCGILLVVMFVFLVSFCSRGYCIAFMVY